MSETISGNDSPLSREYIDQLEQEITVLRQEAEKAAELNRAVGRANAQAAELYVELDDSNEELQRLKDMLDWEMKSASEVQNAIMYPDAPETPALNIVVRTEPATKINGDFYIVHQLDLHSTAIMIADGVGHGVSAALMSIMARSFFLSVTEEKRSAEDIFTELNRRLKDNLSVDGYVTAFLIAYDSDLSILRYVGAGHPRVLLWRAVDGSTQALESEDPVLGVLADHQYREQVVQVAVGDRIFLYTDGIPEARNEAREFFSEEKLEEFLCVETSKNTLEEQAKLLFERMDLFAGGVERTDDQTFVGIEILMGTSDSELETMLRSYGEGSEKSSYVRLFNIGGEFIRYGRYQNAVSVYERLLAINPGNIQARYNLGLSCFKMGATNDGQKNWNVVLSSLKAAAEKGYVPPEIKAVGDRINKSSYMKS